MTRTALTAICFLLLTVFSIGTAAAQDQPDRKTKPLWEIVFGGGGIYGPDYPASDEYHVNGLALPYPIYRGDILRLGEDAIARAVALKSSRFEFDVSLDGSFNASSDDNEARRGMPDLDYMGEVGPQLTIHARKFDLGDMGRGALDVALQARLVASTDFTSIESRGFVFEPELVYNHYRFLGTKFNLYASVAPVFASEDLMDYFYEVDREYVRTDRPEYDASAGYLGTELKLGFSRQLTDSLHVYLGGTLGFHQGATNHDSPLFKQETTAAAAFGFVWSLYKSDKTVERP